MSKKKKHHLNKQHPAPAPASAPSPLSAPISSPAAGEKRSIPLAEALAAGRIRKAFVLAKELLACRDLSANELALVANATERKAQQMHREGNADQIDMMAQSMLKRAPLLAGLIRPEYLALFHRKPPFDRYESDPDIRAQLDAFVLRLLRDPAELAENKDLPDQHPLKQSARLIMATWEKIEAGHADLDELNRAIGRRSPFVAWRLFLNALNAWYNGQNDDALENLRRIPDDAALCAMAAELLSVIRDETHSPIAVQIKSATASDPLRQNLQELEDIIQKNGSYKQAQTLLRQSFTPELLKKSPVLHRNLAALLMHLTDRDAETNARWNTLCHGLGEGNRACAIFETQSQQVSPNYWLFLLEACSFTTLEKALIYDWLACAYSLKLHPDQDRPPWRRKQTISKQNALLIYHKMASFWEKSIACHPLRETFRKWHSIAEAIITPAQSDKILEQWLDVFPDDEAAARKLLKSTRGRQVNTKATTLLQRLQERFPQDPELNNDAAFLELEKALAALKKGDRDKALAILGDEPPATGLFFAAFHRLLRNSCGECKHTPYPIIDAFLWNRLADKKFRIPAENQLPPDEVAAKDFFTETDAIFAVTDPVWGNAQLFELHLPAKLTGLESIDSERLWQLCAHFLEHERFYHFGRIILALLWNLSGSGLARRDPRWNGAFLLTRVLVYILVSMRYVGNNAHKHLQQKALALLVVAGKCLRDTENFAPLKFERDYQDRLDNYGDNDLVEKRLHCSAQDIDKAITNSISTRLDDLLSRQAIPDSSYPCNETQDYPTILHNFTLADNSDDDDDDYDEDKSKGTKMDFLEKQLREIQKKIEGQGRGRI